MKKVLLGTTALAAVSMLASVANAADPVTLSVGGYYRTAVGVILDEDDGAGEGGQFRRDYYHEQDVEVHFTGETTLDNGLTVGVNVQLEGNTAGDQLDETWAYISGSWGELRVGDEDDVAYNFAYIAPYVGIFSAYTPWFAFSNSGATAGNVMGSSTNFEALGFFGDNTKLYYTTPSFNGFQLGASYAPDATQNAVSNANNDGCFGCGPTDVGGGLGDIWSVGLGYSGEFSNVTVGFSAGYVKAVSETLAATSPTAFSNEDPEAYGFGLNLGYGNWAFGGSWQEFDTDNQTFDEEVWDIGLTYSVGAWGFGIGFSQSDVEDFRGNGDVNDVYVLEVAYSMGPGIALNAGLGYNDFDNNAAGGTGPDYQSLSAAVGMTIDY